MSPLNITQPLGINGLFYGYYKVMSNSPKMGHLPIPEQIEVLQILQIFGATQVSRQAYTAPLGFLGLFDNWPMVGWVTGDPQYNIAIMM